MKNLTINSTALRNLFSLAIIIVGLLLWVPQSWAATIHSTTAGGDWNKAETWVGGQVPTENDSVVVNGVVNVSGATVKEIVISKSAILQSHATSSDTLTVNGDITNNGIIKNTDEGAPFYIRVAGNITNNGQWNNAKTTFFGELTSTIYGQILTSKVVFDKDLSIASNSFTFAEEVSFNGHKLILPHSAKITAQKDTQGGIQIEGENITFIFKGKNVGTPFEMISSNSTLLFERIVSSEDSDSQMISGTYNAKTVILSGNVKKEVSGATINGSVVVEKDVVLQSNATSSDTLTVNGDITNNGIIKNTDEGAPFYIRVAGNITNNGQWNNAKTTFFGELTSTIYGQILTSKVVFDKDLSIASNSFTFAEEVSFNGHKLILPHSAKITAQKDTQGGIQIEGENITFIFKGKNVGTPFEMISSNSTLLFERIVSGEDSDSQMISGTYNAKTVILSGNVKKEVSGATINGSVVVEKDVVLQSNATSSDTLTVNGDITNNGITKNADEGAPFYIRVAGNITNNGQWNNAKTTFFGELTSTIYGQILTSKVVFDKDLSIASNSFTFAEEVSFNGHKLILPYSARITAQKDTHGGVQIEGENIAFIFKGKNVGTSFEMISSNSTLLFERVVSGEDYDSQMISGTYNAKTVILSGNVKKEVSGATINGSVVVEKDVVLQSNATSSDTLTVNGDITNNGIIKNTDEGAPFYIRVSGNILNNGTWNNSSTTLTFPSGKFRMTGTPTWEEPKRTSSYEITDYLNTQHHWQVSVDGVLSEQRGINDPSLVALPVVAEPTLPEPDTGATISSVIKPKVYITTNSYLYSKESPYISVYVSTDVEEADMTEELYDIYVAVGGPNGLALFDSGRGISGLTTEAIPYSANVTVMQSDWVETFNYEFTDYASAGDYFVHIGVLSKDGHLISEDSVDLVYDPDYKDPFLAVETSTRSSYDRTNRAGIDGINYIEQNASLSDALKVYYPELKQKLKMYDVVSSANDGLNLLEEAGGIIFEYVNDGKDCDIDETQRDFLLVARTMEYVLNKYSVYKGANIKFAGALKEIYKAENQRLIKYQGNLAGSVFLKFEHATRFWRIDSAGQRTLKVEVKPIFYFPYQCFRICNKKYYHQMSEAHKRGDIFEVQSKKKNWGDNRHELTNVIPGAYSITATDTTNGLVYRTNRVFKKLGETVTITFDYDGDYEEISTQPTGIECF